MVLTIDFITRKFRGFNNEYFDGKLQTPLFEITHAKSYLDQYHFKYGSNYDCDGHRVLVKNVIRISDRYDRSETDYCNTLIHECIHLYIWQNNIKGTRPHHGSVFNSIVDRINHQGGWRIARTDSIDGCGLTDKSSANEYYVVCFLSGLSGKYFQFCINKKYIEHYKNMFENNPKHYRNPFVFVSTDDKKYAHYTACYKSVRGYFISKKQYDTLKANEKIILEWQSLGIVRKAA